ncbi:uncharacterized protein A4U43_C01F31720 [Asparagus officinalis]|uniref:Uncharacterized protein n=2 Tax=Asparagus officinalis TaxID=4686 RepID=A0A5P1FUL3_ASPOF|nr:uncharacterized protein A4U43_C01F31720 [Asparagus officinalis]
MQLRRILGVGMSDRMWEGTIAHARTCPIGDRFYVHRKQHCTVFLNALCQVMAVAINGSSFSLQELTRAQKAYVQEMVLEAYRNWDKLEDCNANVTSCNALVVQNQPIPQASLWYPGSDIQIEDFDEIGATASIHWG